MKIFYKSIFPVFSILPDEISWEQYLYDLTPVEKVGDMFFKREDYFAPLGYGGINGSKLRQAIWIVNEQYEKNDGKSVLISGASIKSPQLCMSSAVASHFGYKSVHVIGATRPDTCMKRKMVEMATWFGAEFIFLKVGYNPVLQSKVDSMVKSDSKFFKLNYGITLCDSSTPEQITLFHFTGANQVKNIPDHIENLIVPFGSGNSAISILYGLSKFKPKNLKNVYLMGIGPNKLEFLNKRLKLISEYDEVNALNFELTFESDKLNLKPDLNPYKLHYLDIHSIPKYDYQNEVKFKYEDIIFHPTYEGKMMDYLTINRPDLINENTMFWIVGSEPSIKNMGDIKHELGEVPTIVKTYHNGVE
jgi:1-aminocyclopropane-1-carboxylate deaminase/D-cysteine desulfhydrase-like pyridoxal-dependent ACC family enzyme